MAAGGGVEDDVGVAQVDVKRWADRAQANADVALETSAKEREWQWQWQRPRERACVVTGRGGRVCARRRRPGSTRGGPRRRRGQERGTGAGGRCRARRLAAAGHGREGRT